MKKTKGFTLIEMVLALGLMSILAAVVGPVLLNAAKAFDVISSRRQLVAEVKSGMHRMKQEIRLIPGSAQVITIAATSFQFQYPTGTSITYSLSGGNLLRNSDILIGNMNALAFSYYDETGNVTATAANVRSVGIEITANSAFSASTYTVRSRVFLTNTGHNYANFTSP